MSPPPPPPTPALLPPPGPTVLNHHMLPTGSLSPTPTALPPLFLSALAIRHAVFVLGQNCNPALEIDADDAVAWLWVIHAPGGDGGKVVPAATVRLVPAHAPGGEEGGARFGGSGVWDGEEVFVRLGRLATVEGFRGRGYGGLLVETALGFAGGHGGEMGEGWRGLVLIHAQVGVRGWYEGLGWVGDEGMGRWLEEGIEHLGMWRRVDVEG